MLRSSLALFVFLALSLAGTAQAQEFSADIRATENGRPATGTENSYKQLYVSGERLRAEAEARNLAFVIIADKDAGWALFPASKTYRPADVAKFALAFALPGSVDAVCRREAAAKCGMTGRSRIHGRRAIGFSYIGHGGEQELGWIDEKLGALLKYVEIDRKHGRTNIVELVNIQEGQQPDDLFKVPADYRQITATGLVAMPAETGNPGPPAESHQ